MKIINIFSIFVSTYKNLKNMGCHTWFCKKLNPQPSYEEVKSEVIQHLKYNIKYFNDYINNYPNFKDKIVFYDFTIEESKNYIKLYERQCRMIENNLCKKAVCNKYKHKLDLTYFIENKGFFIACDYTQNDIFRINKYEDTILFSFSETIDFITINRDKINYFKENWLEKLIDFWNNNPDGFIKFG